LPLHKLRDLKENVDLVGILKLIWGLMDYKYRIQQFADQLADEMHGCDFYDLSVQLQDQVHGQAIEMWRDVEMEMVDRNRQEEI